MSSLLTIWPPSPPKDVSWNNCFNLIFIISGQGLNSHWQKEMRWNQAIQIGVLFCWQQPNSRHRDKLKKKNLLRTGLKKDQFIFTPFQLCKIIFSLLGRYIVTRCIATKYVKDILVYLQTRDRRSIRVLSSNRPI